MATLSDTLRSFLESKGLLKATKAEPEEEMVSIEVVYEPDTKDAHGEWMSADTIEKGCANFNKNLEKGGIQSNLFHVKGTDKFSIEKSWINHELDVTVDASGETVKAGSWLVKVKYHDKKLWALKKANVIQGVSMGCMGFINEETGEITDLSFDGEDDE